VIWSVIGLYRPLVGKEEAPQISAYGAIPCLKSVVPKVGVELTRGRIGENG